MLINLDDLNDEGDNPKYPSMDELMEESCPMCAGEYKVGDYVCWDMCYKCAKRNGLLPEFLS